MDLKNIEKNWPIVLFVVLFFGPMLSSIFGKNLIPVLILIFALYILYKKYNNHFSLQNRESGNIIDIDKLDFMNHLKNKFLTIILVILGIWLFFASIVIVDAGETGVYSLFGRVKDSELRSGFHLVIPLARVTKMSIRTEEYTMSIAQGEGKKYNADAISALTKEGLSVDLDITVLYHLEEEKASDIYKNVGLTYEEKIIRPTIRTAIRDIIAQYEAKDIYSEKREEAAKKILGNLKQVLDARGLIAEEVLLRNVALPARLTTSIQEKLQAEQEAEKYDFILEKEKKEKERKIIEAEGQRDAQKIINQSLSTNYLYYLYISNLRDREGTVYVPTSPGTGMPLFRDIGR